MSTDDLDQMVRILTMDGKVLTQKLGGWTGTGGNYFVAWGYAQGRNISVRLEYEGGRKCIVNPDGTIEEMNK